jgi:hypothetical protein
MKWKLAFSTIIVLMALALISGPITAFFPLKEASFQENRQTVLNQLSASINEARLEGKYNCCIDPPCTMCYLGNWLWPDGTCRCDEAIANGEFEKVCPQCSKGPEEGQCLATAEQECEE